MLLQPKHALRAHQRGTSVTDTHRNPGVRRPRRSDPLELTSSPIAGERLDVPATRPL
jgi:hypothetical protein